MENKINKLQKILGVKFRKKKLLVQAITHKSYNTKNNYEKLEFLGDRVLGITISSKLVELYPNEKVGILDKKFSLEWSKYRNSLLLTNDQGLNVVRTKLHKIISV